MVGVGGQALDHGVSVGVRCQAQRRGAAAQGLHAGDELGPPVTQLQDGGLEDGRRRLRRPQVRGGGEQALAQGADAPVRRPPLAQRQERRGEGQAHRAGGGDQGGIGGHLPRGLLRRGRFGTLAGMRVGRSPSPHQPRRFRAT